MASFTSSAHHFTALLHIINFFLYCKGGKGVPIHGRNSNRYPPAQFEPTRVFGPFRDLSGPFGSVRALSGPFGSFRALSNGPKKGLKLCLWLTCARATAATSSRFFTSSMNAWHFKANLTSARCSSNPGRYERDNSRQSWRWKKGTTSWGERQAGKGFGQLAFMQRHLGFWTGRASGNLLARDDPLVFPRN